MYIVVSVEEFQANFDEYFARLSEGDIRIKVDGKIVAKLTAVGEQDNIDKLLSMRGILPDTGQTKESIREERLREKYGLED